MVPPAGTVDGLRWSQWFARTWADVLGVEGQVLKDVVAVHEHRTASRNYAEGLRASDPRRVAVYFQMHNLLHDKTYQHVVPEAWQGEGDGPGRFWGYWGLQRADLAVAVTEDQAHELARLLNRWNDAKHGIRVAQPIRRRARRLPFGGKGFSPVESAVPDDLAGCYVDATRARAIRTGEPWTPRPVAVVVADTDPAEYVNERTGEVLDLTPRIRRRRLRRRIRASLRTRGFLIVNDGPAVGLMLADGLRSRQVSSRS
jgi:hypothetical protein